MYRWFTNYTGRSWTPEKGYNSFFAEHVRLLRQWFRLKKVRKGVEASTDFWRKYRLQGRIVYVNVERMTWTDLRRYGSYISPVFHLKLRLAQKRKRGFLASIFDDEGESQQRLEVFFKQPFIIEFPRNYPSEPPRFRVDNQRYDVSSASHSHHMFAGGWFCILADHGDWNRRRDTIISGFNAALDWIVWHHKKFGW